MIPANVDVQSIIADLNGWGLGDRKIEMICGFSDGYITHMKRRQSQRVCYVHTARLYNFWFDECALHGRSVSWASTNLIADNSQHLAATT